MSHSGVDGLPKTLQELPDCELDQPCTDLHLCCIANEIIEWERIAPHLGIGAAEVREIQCDSKGYRQQKLTALRKWKNKHGTSSTYRNLIQIFHQLERQSIAIVQTESELDRPCSEADLALLANRLDDWEKVAAKMGITEAEKNEIQHDSASYWHEKYLALLKWRQKHGSRATMRKLIQILSELEEQITARSILAVHDDSALDTFRAYLKQCYQQQQPPSAGNWPIMEHPVYVEPTLMKVQDYGKFVNQEGRILDTIPVCMSDILKKGLPYNVMQIDQWSTMFAIIGEPEIPYSDMMMSLKTGTISPGGITPGKPKHVLIEGTAGAGKSTLLWYATQEWAKGKLFQDLDLLISISFADPAIRGASSLADLIPHPDRKIRETVASYIAQTGGENIGIFLDGIDLIPPQEQKHHYITKLLRGSPGIALPNASILATSRPEGSKDLLVYFTSNIKLIGFSTKQQIESFFNSVTATDHSAMVNYHQISVENPMILGLCNLPINAAIIAFLLSVLDKPLPSRKTELFRYFLLNLLLRHIRERTMHGSNIDCLEEFEDLEDFEDVALAFQQLCHLAWSGILDCKVVLTRQDVRKAGINPRQLNGLGLLQHKPSLSAIGWSVQYVFLHQSVQEFLAALHVSKLPPNEQVTAAFQLIKRNPAASVLPFLVGITKIFSVVQVLCDEYTRNYSHGDVMQYFLEDTKFNFGEINLQLFSCMYESQSPDCCAVLTNSLSRFQLTETTGLSLAFPKHIDQTAYAYLGFYLGNCFLKTHAACIPMFLFTPNGNLGATLMIKEFMDTRSTLSASSVHSNSSYLFLQLHMVHCGLTHTGTATICRNMSSLQPIMIIELNLEGNWHPKTTDINAALTVLVETLASYPLLLHLSLSGNNISSKHTWHLVLMLCFSNLDRLNIAYNHLEHGIPLIASALRYTKRLKYLKLKECHITSRGLLSLGDSLACNNKLHVLQMSRNPYSTSTFTTFLKILKHNKTVQKIITSELTSEHIDVINDINRSRYRDNLPQLEVGEESCQQAFYTIQDVRLR